MNSPTYRGPRAVGAIIVMVVLAATVLLGVAPANAVATSRAKAAPQLSISIDDGMKAAKVGDRLAYKIVVDNLGADPVKGLVVTQTMPEGLDFATADSGGFLSGAVVTWQVRVPVGGQVTLHASAQVSATPADTLRLASVACASINAGAPPVVCGSHSDLLPAGAVAARAAAPTASHKDQAAGSGAAPWALGGGLVLVLGGVAGGRLIRRRRRTALIART